MAVWRCRLCGHGGMQNPGLSHLENQLLTSSALQCDSAQTFSSASPVGVAPERSKDRSKMSFCHFSFVRRCCFPPAVGAAVEPTILVFVECRLGSTPDGCTPSPTPGSTTVHADGRTEAGDGAVATFNFEVEGWVFFVVTFSAVGGLQTNSPADTICAPWTVPNDGAAAGAGGATTAGLLRELVFAAS